jgi:hypothetical protein
VTDAGRDDNALVLADGNNLAIQFHLSVIVALQEEIHLRQRLVVMSLSIFRDFCNVNCPWKFGDIGKCAPGSSTRTRHACDVCKVGLFPAANMLGMLLSHRGSGFQRSTKKCETACTLLCRRVQKSAVSPDTSGG